MIRFFLIRHGKTLLNQKAAYMGSLDESLSLSGREELSLIVPPENIDHLYVSPMKRAKESAEILFPGCCYTEIPDFREMDFGIFEGKTPEELDSPFYRQWLDSFCEEQIPEGEALSDFKARVKTAFKRILQQSHDHERIALVVHGGVIMAILEAFCDEKKSFFDYHLKNGEIRELYCEKAED